MSTNTQRVIVFAVAVIAQVVVYLVQGFGFDSTSYYWFVVVGLEGLIIYELMYRTQNWVRWLTLPIYGLAFLIIETIIDTVVAGYLYDFSASDALGRIETYTQYLTNPALLIPSAVVLLVAFFLIARDTISLPGLGNLGNQFAAVDKVMLEISDDLVTRLLCASAITNGSVFRKKVLDRVENRHHGVAPEFGLDLELVTAVCQFVEKRETKFQYAFFIIGLVGILLGGYVPFALPMIILTAPVMFIKVFNERFDLLKEFANQNYDREKIKRRFAIRGQLSTTVGLPRPDQNLVIYSGFLPFIGAGFDLGGWSFALDISRPKNELGRAESVEEFELGELYKEIEGACTDLNIPSLNVANFYFVNGLDVRNDRAILPEPMGKPSQCVDENDLKTVDDFRIRQYKHISVSAWGNDIIFSIFLRCTKKGKNLFVEAARYLLPPVAVQYRNLNQLANKNWTAILGIGLISLVLGPINGYFAGLTLLGKFLNFVNKSLGLDERRVRNEIKNNSNFDYGVTTSFRQEVTGATYLHYFQKADREMFVKILDNEILETLITFLDNHNIDTSQLRERQNSILNNGIIVQGGNIQSQSIAVGEGAKSTAPQGKPA